MMMMMMMMTTNRSCKNQNTVSNVRENWIRTLAVSVVWSAMFSAQHW